jgi:hypothetical protein
LAYGGCVAFESYVHNALHSGNRSVVALCNNERSEYKAAERRFSDWCNLLDAYWTNVHWFLKAS